MAAPAHVAQSPRTGRMGRPVTSALIWSQSAERAPPPTTRTSSPPISSAAKRSTMSRSANAQPSSTERERCAAVWLSARPANEPRMRSFQRGAVEPDRAGRNSAPSLPGGASSARANSSACEIPWAPAHQSVLPPDTKPGFSTSRRSSAACACVSTRRCSSSTASYEGTATGSAVPVTSTTMPGRSAPAPSAAPWSSPVPVTTRQRVVRPSASAAAGRSGPIGSRAERIGGSRAGSRSGGRHELVATRRGSRCRRAASRRRWHGPAPPRP